MIQNCSKNKLLIALFAIILLLPAIVSARDVVSNSADWRDVYSTLIYGNLDGATTHFLTGTAHGPIMLFEIPQDSDQVEIITSADKPFYVGYESLFKSRGYTNVNEEIYDLANLELAKKLTNINNYIIIDGAYGYNALAVGPYAVRAKYYVIFANSRNIDEVTSFLSTKSVGKIIIYGHVDREVNNALAQYNPEILNSDSGSRFENNMLIMDKFAEIGDIRQVILTNGEFIESSMLTGNEPVLFIGKNNVPDEVKEYINKKGIEIGVLIGNELIGTATDIRRQVGISVFVKFARGSRIPGGTINPVEDLDRFPMPSYQLSLSIASVSYNRATGQLEVTYRNNVDLATYFRSTITIKNANGEIIVVEGDNDTVFIDGSETKTIVYNKISEVDAQQITDKLSAEVYTIYGESKNSLENVVRATLDVEFIDIKDNADISILDLVYEKSKGRFLVTVENTGTTDAYVSIELVDLWINGEYVTVSSDEIVKIEPGKQAKIPVNIIMSDEDLVDKKNAIINVRAIYGERIHALIKVKTKQFELKVKNIDLVQYAMILGGVVIIILIMLFLRRKKKKCQRCRTMNDNDAQNCKKCGHPFN